MSFVPYEIDAGVGLVVITWPPSAPQVSVFRETVDRLFADPAFRPFFGVVSDWREMTGPPNVAYAQAFVDFHTNRAAAGHTGRWATVVPSNAVASFGMGRLIEARTDMEARVEYRVFKDFERARRWAAGLSNDEDAD